MDAAPPARRTKLERVMLETLSRLIDHLLRNIDETVDSSAVREQLADLSCADDHNQGPLLRRPSGVR